MLLNFVPCDDVSRAPGQEQQDTQWLRLQFDRDSVLEELARKCVQFKRAKSDLGRD